ncbi:MAG TPA: thiamine phosphate synthase, partial [Thermoanaerobaculia bacterium]
GLPMVDLVQRMVEGGARWIQYREKDLDDAARYAELQEVVAALPAIVKLFVNDRLDLAIACGADGLHVGDEDLPPQVARKVAGPDLLIGYSTHSVEDGAAAAADPAIDYVAIGPIYRSSTKDVREPLGLGPIRELRRRIEKPIVAIGGIDPHNIADVLGAGADSAAVIGAIHATPAIAENVARLVEAARAR